MHPLSGRLQRRGAAGIATSRIGRSVLEREGVDTQVITFTTPGTHVESPERAVRFARMVNDAFAEIVEERSPRFRRWRRCRSAIPPASVAELTRAVTSSACRARCCSAT